jgi:hypothetical protein
MAGGIIFPHQKSSKLFLINARNKSL